MNNVLKNLFQHKLPAAGVLLTLGIAFNASGNTGDVDSLNITIHGTVEANGTCVFNQGSELQVDFGKISLKTASDNTVQLTGDYVKSLASDFSCSGDTAGLLQMQLSDASGSYEDYSGTKVLRTDKGIVGVELLVNGVAKSAGQWFTVDENSPPTLQAALVQVSNINTSQVVSGDLFSASGTLTLAFN